MNALPQRTPGVVRKPGVGRYLANVKTRGFAQRCATPGVFLLLTTSLLAQPQWQDVVRNLRHPRPETRLEAVERLGEAGYVPAIEPVAPLIADPDDRVQAAALDAELTFFLAERLGGGGLLGRGGSKSRAQQAFETGPLIRTATPAPAALLDALISAMRDENLRVRFDAIHALGFIAEPPLAPPHLNALIGELDHYDPIIRAATARVLGRLQARGAGPALMTALGDSQPVVRQFAAEALGLVREDRALPQLRDLADHGRGDMPGVALLALARIGSPDDLPRFQARVNDRDTGVRAVAIEGLGRLRHQPSQAVITQHLQTARANEVRLAAAFALQQLGETQSHVIASLLAIDAVRMQAQLYLLDLGAAGLPGVHAALKVATGSRHRADLIQLVGRFGTATAIQIVEPFLGDRDERVVRAATNAIVRLKRAAN